MTATAVRTRLAPFSAALEERDAEALLAMFSSNAEVRFSNCATAMQPPRSITRKSAIAHRIFKFCAADQVIRVVDEVDNGNELTVIAECHQQDGSLFVLAINATLVDGLVRRLFVVLV
jgi:hypothetical protein